MPDSTFRTHDVVPGVVHVNGAFRPNGSSALANTEARNTLFGVATVVRNSAGNYTVTLPFGAARVRRAHADLQLNAIPAATPALWIRGPVTVTANAISFVIQYTENNVAADIADNANNWIHYSLTLDNGTVPL
jgi:hypothetical protein